LLTRTSTHNQAKVRKFGWAINFVLRRLLARIPLVGDGRLFNEPVFLLVQRGGSLTYSAALRRANRTTVVLTLLEGVMMLRWAVPQVAALAVKTSQELISGGI
jgi:hypothetical protein